MSSSTSQARRYLQRGQFAEARQVLELLLEKQPQDHAALALMGIVCAELGELNTAIEQLNKALNQAPHNPDYYNNLGVILERSGDRSGAMACYQRALAADRNNAGAYANLGKLYQERAMLGQALACYQRSLSVDNNNVEVLTLYCTVLRELGLPDEARRHIDVAIRRWPDYYPAYTELACIHMGMGDSDRALAWFEKSTQMGGTDAYYEIARIVRLQRDESEIAQRLHSLEGVLAKMDAGQRDAVPVIFALGELCDRLGRYEEAFAFFQDGNALEKPFRPLDRSALHDDILRRIASIESVNTSDPACSKAAGEDLLFVVGMPRSGTTLIEQLLAGHPRVQSRGESSYIQDIERSLFGSNAGTTAMDLSNVQQSTLDQHARQYRKLNRMQAAPGSVFIDKTASNFRHLGLIAKMFPRARIIHCCRDPLDTALSNYFQFFKYGNEYSFDLDAIADYYQDYAALMGAWKRGLSIAMYPVHYESFTQNPGQQGRDLFEFCGLEWSDDFLALDERRGFVNTASNVQVRQKIYQSSVRRWQHYASHLGPLKRLRSTLGQASA